MGRNPAAPDRVTVSGNGCACWRAALCHRPGGEEVLQLGRSASRNGQSPRVFLSFVWAASASMSGGAGQVPLTSRPGPRGPSNSRPPGAGTGQSTPSRYQSLGSRR